MALIAKINGVPVYSDKEVKAVANTRVTFRDGSWCDTRTGEVHSVGSGFVSIGGGGSDPQTKKVTEGPKWVSASALELKEVAADIEVSVHNSSKIEYTITGPEELVKAIRTNVRSGTLIVEGNGPRSSGTSIMSSGNIMIGSNMSVTNFYGGNSVVMGDGDESDVKITVKVPRGTTVTSTNVHGNVTIGDIDGPLTAHATTSSRVSAGRVTSANLTASSSAEIDVAQANGNVIANASSSGSVSVDEGSVPVLSATASSSGNIHIGGIVESAPHLKASSSGSIRVARVRLAGF